MRRQPQVAVKRGARVARYAIGALALLALGGCAAVLGPKGPPGPCPQTAILAEAEHETAFRPGPGRDLIDVIHEAELARFQGACQYDMEDDGSGRLLVEVAPVFTVSRGPADTSRRAEVDYFVAVTDSDGTILNKSQFRLGVDFPGNLSRAAITDEPVSLHIDLAPGRTGADYRVLLGLQLTPEQLEFNRRRRGQR